MKTPHPGYTQRPAAGVDIEVFTHGDTERCRMSPLNNRERFAHLFNGECVDRAPFLDIMGFWNSSLERWKQEGLSQDATPATVRRLVGFDSRRGFYLPVKAFIWPEFEPQVIRRDGDKFYTRNCWGAIEENITGSELMSITIEGPVTDRKSWEQIKARLDPDTPGRLPRDWLDMCAQARESGETVYAGDLPIGFFGGVRELLGFEHQATLFYDDPSLMEDILDTLCDLWIKVFTRVQQDIVLDWFFIWEDMCYKGGSLISSRLFRRFLLPRYQRLTAAVRGAGCLHIMVDSDGDERPLVPLWLEGGVNIVFPWETQFGLDITAVRCQYPTLGMIGGMNKYALALGREAIDKELAKLPFMLEQGRFIPGLDHGVPNDVSWDNYRYFYDHMRELIYKYPPA